MTIDEYLDVSGKWLVETTYVYDVAVAAEKCFHHDYEPPLKPTEENTPYLSSYSGAPPLKMVIPFCIATSIEQRAAAGIVKGPNPPKNEKGGVRIEFVTESVRINSIMARFGIISQFELWKSFAAEHKWPINKKQCESYAFANQEVKTRLLSLIERRNSLTHEVKAENDPTMRELIEFYWSCKWVSTELATGP